MKQAEVLFDDEDLAELLAGYRVVSGDHCDQAPELQSGAIAFRQRLLVLPEGVGVSALVLRKVAAGKVAFAVAGPAVVLDRPRVSGGLLRAGRVMVDCAAAHPKYRATQALFRSLAARIGEGAVFASAPEEDRVAVMPHVAAQVRAGSLQIASMTGVPLLLPG